MSIVKLEMDTEQAASVSAACLVTMLADDQQLITLQPDHRHHLEEAVNMIASQMVESMGNSKNTTSEETSEEAGDGTSAS